MYVLPFAVPGFKWVLVEQYFDPQSNTVVRARDSHRNAFCLLVAVGSTVS